MKPKLAFGDLVFFKRAKKSNVGKPIELTFSGQGFGVLLGEINPFKKDPTPNDMFQLMGQLGFLTFDDVAEFLGDESAAIAVKKFQATYHGEEKKEEPVAALPDTALLDINGSPISTVTLPENIPNEPA